jgi:Putative Flp pilus-assembly TadE/G-like
MKLCNRRHARRGTVAVLVAVSSLALLMVLAVTMDAGLLFTEKRHAQATADAAALAGAADLFKYYRTNAGADVNGTAKAAALAIAAGNGYANDGTTSLVDVRTFGDTYSGGPNAGKTIPRGYCEVTVTYNHPRYFSLIFGSGNIPIKARAVAKGTWDVPKFGLAVMAPSGTTLRNSGNGNITVTSGSVLVNSSDPSAIVNQNNGVITADEISVVGGIADAGTIVTDPIPNNIHTGVPSIFDPFAILPAPTPPAPGGISQKLTGAQRTTLLNDLVASGQITKAFADGTNWNVYLASPGSFDSMQTFQSSDLVVFQQASAGNGGMYYLNSGGFHSTGATLLMDPGSTGGIMFYNNGAGQSDGFLISGNGSGVVNLIGEAGGTYQGFVLYQNRNATEPISITGNGSFKILGAIYAPNADLAITGNGTSQTIGSQVITKTVTIGGNGSVNIDSAGGVAAPVRTFRLVE